TAFSHREEQLLAALTQAKDVDQAIAACAMALEQTACELAQDEQDDVARQRMQAVMACARRAPQMLRACEAQGELVMDEAPAASKKGKLQMGVKLLGGFLLAALAVYELIEGRTTFAVLQLAGAGLLAFFGGQKEKQTVRARGIPCIHAKQKAAQCTILCKAAHRSCYCCQG
ncbi:MAG: hypothetical protein IIW94_05615, partial [Clostridia bacterium]|nr:hypothetical protein [Clostridia bacterium]